METSQTLHSNRAAPDGGFFRKYRQVIILVAALLGVNWPLLGDGINTDLVFFTQAVGDGQWWRVLTYPLVHISWYHLLLDGGAFLLLYHSFEEKRFLIRAACIAGAGIGSLALALALEPAINYRGLCGLSGVAHGLMAITGLEMIIGGRHRLLGLASLLLVVSKSAWELWTGQVMFAGMHFGEYGTPLVACHGGGVLGGLMIYGILRTCRRRMNQPKQAQEVAA